jgi:beta-xylosidase
VGAAIGTSPLGPFRDLGRPLVHDPNPGVIDVHFFEAPDGARYLLWKLDGNAVRARTPIYIQRLAADGVTLMGTRTTLITNDRAWEGALVEGPWMIFEGGMYYLFYSANGYASNAYAVGVARSSSPTGPFTKAAAPILVTKGAWAGPGHGSIVRGPSGDWVHVYHAWVAGSVGQAPGRQVLVDRITFNGGWPQMLAAPSSRSQPMP